MSSTGFDQNAYLGLVATLPLRPIRSDRELDRATKMIDSLLERPKLTKAEQDYLDVLTDLVEKYEAEAYPAQPASDAEMLAHLLDARGMSQTELATKVGIAGSTISEVLHGKRQLRREHVARLAAFFGVSTAVFGFDRKAKEA
ncbi:MAG TPA: helix-turn-helix domain-containing protein [Pirellulales bacterium]|nr:helix-turn-helix domain-containing protein [Pirellulales bacterium]